jgi:hypothetical protein
VVNKDIFKGHSGGDPQSVQLQHYAKLVTEMTPRTPVLNGERGRRHAGGTRDHYGQDERLIIGSSLRADDPKRPHHHASCYQE